jgi:hypothetical protein
VRIEVELPDFPDYENERHMRIMMGVELAASKLPGEPWKVKTVRCDLCGKCCMNLGDGQPFPITTTNGVCDHLEKEPGKDSKTYRCALALQRPFGCCVGEPDKDYCIIEWVEAK